MILNPQNFHKLAKNERLCRSLTGMNWEEITSLESDFS